LSITQQQRQRQQQQQQQQPSRLNLSFPLRDVKMPAATNLCCGRDRDRINSILQSGLLPTVDWNAVKKEMTLSHFDFVDSSCTRQHQVVVNVDSLLLKKQADAHVLHNTWCMSSPSVAAETTDVSVQLDEEIVGGIKAVGKPDQMQTSEEAACSPSVCGIGRQSLEKRSLKCGIATNSRMKQSSLST
jgi:hypothetical protein